MIAPLLVALREKDPATWQRFDELELATYKQYDDFGSTENYIYQEDLIKPVRMAWLQAVLQDACQARGWLLKQSTFTARPSAKIWKVVDPIGKMYYAEGDSPAEALLAAYLEAIR